MKSVEVIGDSAYAKASARRVVESGEAARRQRSVLRGIGRCSNIQL